jgi:site-specific recombinase XerD
LPFGYIICFCFKNHILPLEKKESKPYVFCGGIPGEHLKEIKKTWRKVRKLADISDVRLHGLRHFFASFSLKKGVDLYTVSKFLEHKHIATTTRYAHLELVHLKKATNIVAEMFK